MYCGVYARIVVSADYHHPVPPGTLQLLAHAKINLALTVGPPGEGGLHPIVSWMTAIDLADEITVSRLGTGEDTVFERLWADGSPVPWPEGSDLVVRAHRAAERVAGRLPARVSVIKHIPAGGGLGGGSSDAAAVLRALDALFDLRLGHERLVEIAVSLGSDLPFFLDDAAAPGGPPRHALVSGLGDRVERLGPGRWGGGTEWVLICPPFGCETAAVYRAFDADPGVFRPAEVERLARGSGFEPSALFNDLAPGAEAVRPGLGRLRRDLSRAMGVAVHVSGSGSTLFVIDPPGGVDRVRGEVSRIEPGAIVVRTGPT